jgi:urease beta subunit
MSEKQKTRNSTPVGGLVLAAGDIEMNIGRPTVTMKVRNTGDRPIQVGSHFHFFETNRYLEFDRALSFGLRLDIPSTTGIRFEPGDEKEVTLVPMGGKQFCVGFNNLVDGWTGVGPNKNYRPNLEVAVGRAAHGFKSSKVRKENWLMSKISRRQYADLFGPTTGDKIRLGDTDLYVEIEKDFRVYGDELVTGGGKTLRDGMGSDNQLTQDAGCLDLVITNVTILDPVLGVIKADVGVRNGRIVGIGKAGNSSTMDGVTMGLSTGTSTDAITGEHLILTAASMDTHVHYICPQQVEHALSNGTTTFWGGRIGPTDRTLGVTSTNDPWNLEMMMRAAEGLPINIGFQGKGNSSGKGPLVEQLRAGAAGFKIHEDYGTTAGCIRSCLSVADEYDVSVAIHTDTLNESGFVVDTIAAFDGRTIHTYHSEGAGGGLAPDLLKVIGQSNVLAEFHQSHAALRRELGGRVIRHDHGLPQLEPEDSF